MLELILFPADRRVERLARCLLGLVLFGVGISMLIGSDLGAAPWDVFHTGLSNVTGLAVGRIIIVVGVLLLVLWIPLRERPGIGTILNAIVIGLVVDIVLPMLPSGPNDGARIALMASGIAIVALGSGLYIGAGLGPGPRDGLMTGLAKFSVGKRAVSIRLARTFIEIVVVVAGVLLGGEIGIGTLAFALGIGPLVQVFLPPLTMDPPAKLRSATG